MTNIIFDFDGTIADSFQEIVHIFEALANLKEPLTEARIEQLRNYSLPDVVRILKIKTWRIPFLLIRGRTLMNARMSHIQPFTGMPETIRELAAATGYQLFILSTNSPSNIHTFLRNNQLEEYFTEVYGGVGLRGKAHSLRAFLKNHAFSPESCLYIGDETRDITAAKAAGMRCIAVTWGFNAERILAEFKADALVERPQDLRRALVEVLSRPTSPME